MVPYDAGDHFLANFSIIEIRGVIIYNEGNCLCLPLLFLGTEVRHER